MTFRIRLRDRLSLPFCFALCVLGIWFCTKYPSPRKALRDGQIKLACLLIAPLALIGSVGAWTTMVSVTDSGVRWRGGFRTRNLRWDEISALGCAGKGNKLRIGLVEAKTGVLHLLPIMPRRLYVLLKERLGPLPPEAVETWFALQGSPKEDP